MLVCMHAIPGMHYTHDICYKYYMLAYVHDNDNMHSTQNIQAIHNININIYIYIYT